MGTHHTPQPTGGAGRSRMVRALRQRVDELEDEVVEVGALYHLERTRADRLQALLDLDLDTAAGEDVEGLCVALAVVEGDLTARDLHPDHQARARAALVAALGRCVVVRVPPTGNVVPMRAGGAS